MDMARRPFLFQVEKLAFRRPADAGAGDGDGSWWSLNIPNGVRNPYRHIAADCVQTKTRLAANPREKRESLQRNYAQRWFALIRG